MRKAVILSLLSTILCLAATPAAAVDTQRGGQLYELRCGTCHSESVHARSNRSAKSFEEITAWVMRWNTTLALNWGVDEIEDVSAFLNATYYRHACPPTVCRLSSMAAQETRLH